jgi:hypothetical protein
MIDFSPFFVDATSLAVGADVAAERGLTVLEAISAVQVGALDY